MSTPGLAFVTSKTKDSKKLSDKQYNRWYNEEHLPDVLTHFRGKGGIANAFCLRYKNADRDSNNLYLALYPVPDKDWLFSPDQAQFQEDMKKSRILGVDNVADHIDFNLRPYEKIQNFEGYGHDSKTGKERGQTLVCVAMEPADNAEAEKDFEDWYRKQHLDMMSMVRNYRRTTRYKRMDGQKPQYLALHEYACRPDELATEQIVQLRETEWAKKILEESPIFDRDVFELIEITFTVKKNYDPYETKYTYFLVDPDVPMDGSPVQVNFLHWVVSHAQPSCVRDQDPDTVVLYEPLTPASTTQHRYSFLVYREPPNFEPDALLLQIRTPFDLNDYVQNNGLTLVGGNFLNESAVNGLQSGLRG